MNKRMDQSSELPGKRRDNESGFVLVAALVCLAVLSIIGISAMTGSNTEKQIAQNINLAEKTFYGADGATEIGIEMIEWNLGCPLGFTGAANAGQKDPTNAYQIRGVELYDSTLAYGETAADLALNQTKLTNDYNLNFPITNLTDLMPFVPSDMARTIRIPHYFDPNANGVARDNAPHMNVAIFGVTTLGEGGSIQMAAGYEGKGKGAAGGGAIINYEIWAQNLGINNAESIIRLGWQHLIGTEGECRPY